MTYDDHEFEPAFDGSDFCTVWGCTTHREDHWYPIPGLTIREQLVLDDMLLG